APTPGRGARASASETAARGACAYGSSWGAGLQASRQARCLGEPLRATGRAPTPEAPVGVRARRDARARAAVGCAAGDVAPATRRRRLGAGYLPPPMNCSVKLRRRSTEGTPSDE